MAYTEFEDPMNAGTKESFQCEVAYTKPAAPEVPEGEKFDGMVSTPAGDTPTPNI